MTQHHKPIFSEIETPRHLQHNIMGLIGAQRRRSARIHILLLSITGVVSGVLLVSVAGHLAQDVYQSGLFEYFSLLFSDGNIVLNSWKGFTLLVVESVPLWGATVALAALFGLLGSFTFAIKNIKIALSRAIIIS